MENPEELTTAIRLADSTLPGEKSAIPIMKFIASAESDYGRTHSSPDALSYGPFQIDPVRYYDITQKPGRADLPKVAARIEEVNKVLRQRFDNPDFDISKLAVYNPKTKDYDSVDSEAMNHPLVGAMLTRLALKQDPKELPEGDDKMADYYLRFWKPRVDSEEHAEEKKLNAKEKYALYHPELTQPADDLFTSNKRFQNAFPAK